MPKQNGRFQGNIVVISGAAGGIGRELLRSFSALGAFVIGIDRKPGDPASKPSFGELIHIQADLAVPLEVESARRMIEQRTRRVDILVNSAGAFSPDSGVNTQSLMALWRDNVLTAAQLSTSLYPLLCRGDKPLVVNLSSTDAIVSSAGQDSEIGVTHDTNYATTKGALITLTRALAMKWAKDGIRVNAICPTITRSPMTKDLLNEAGKEEELRKYIPLGRLCEPKDIAIAVECLYRLEFTTAHVLPLDGGYLCL